MPHPAALFAVAPDRFKLPQDGWRTAEKQIAELNRKRWQTWLEQHQPVRWAEDSIYLSRINSK
jgi:hypothetical protein